MFALVDGWNFFASCTRLFDPSLAGRPLVIAGSNDGCVIARSDEARALGIKMGQPLFEVRRDFRNSGVVARSANFNLFGMLSSRMMTIAAELGTSWHDYSIDEGFAGMDGVPGNLVQRGRDKREKIEQWLGLPTGIGIGRTRTLAKLANHVAKSAQRKPGSYPADLAQVCDLANLPASDFDAVLAATDLGDIWGIGKRISAQLQADGLHTALDVANMDAAMVRRRWSVVLERTVRELQGQACIPFEDVTDGKKEIMCSRSFGRPVTELQDLVEAVTEFAGRAAEKLRKQEGRAGQVLTFIRTSPFREADRQYSRSITMPLRRPTADTGLIAQSAIQGLKVIFRQGYNYAKAGVMLLDLQDGSVEQWELDLDTPRQDRSALMTTMDRINMKYGRGTLQLASAGSGGAARRFSVRAEHRSGDHMTSWSQLPIARA
jgi:DNA polymerase V